LSWLLAGSARAEKITTAGRLYHHPALAQFCPPFTLSTMRADVIDAISTPDRIATLAEKVMRGGAISPGGGTLAFPTGKQR
jgi:hypothetical protein